MTAPQVRELAAGETELAYEAMLELRPGIGSREGFAERVDEVQRPEGYRLAASFDPDTGEAAAVAGFRLGHNLHRGRYIYVDDLVTRSDFRSRGHGAALMAWLIAESERLGCDQLHLDSGVQRFDAHRFYLTHRMRITAHHFDLDIEPR